MEKNFDIQSKDFHCPNCGDKTRVKLEDEIRAWLVSSISIERQTDYIFADIFLDTRKNANPPKR